MPDLAPLTAFGRAAPRRHRFGPLVLVENTRLGLASLAVRRDAPVPEIGGLRLPESGAWAAGTTLSALWMAPGQWMIEATDGADADLERTLGAAMPDAVVTDQTDGWVAIEITSDAGPGPLERVLEKLVNLDLGGFGPGRATRTGIEHMSAFVIRRGPTAAAVLGMRSMAASMWHALEAAASRVAGRGM